MPTRWNLMRPEGWEKYELATDDIAERIIELVDEENDINEVIKKVVKLQDEAKFVAFNKTNLKSNKQLHELKDKSTTEAKDIIQKQSEQIEKEILEIKNNKQGRASQVFKMKARIGGSKKSSQDANSIKDPSSGELLMSTEEIKKNYNL